MDHEGRQFSVGWNDGGEKVEEVKVNLSVSLRCKVLGFLFLGHIEINYIGIADYINNLRYVLKEEL